MHFDYTFEKSMKQLTFLFVGLLIAASSYAQQPKVEFKDSIHYDMGSYQEGEMAEHDFEFSNNGTGDFVIYTVSTTCSCTASEWPKDPIKPGQYGKIKVTFDTRDKLGTYDKGVNLETNIGEINMIITVTVTK